MRWLFIIVAALMPVDALHPTHETLRCWNKTLDTGICGDMYGTPTPPLKTLCMHVVAYACQETP